MVLNSTTNNSIPRTLSFNSEKSEFSSCNVSNTTRFHLNKALKFGSGGEEGGGEGILEFLEMGGTENGVVVFEMEGVLNPPRTMLLCNLQTRNLFEINSRDQVDNVTDQFHL